MAKRILFLTPQLPYPPHQGTTLRNFGLIKGLAERGHQITLLSFIEEGQPPVAETPLPDICRTVIAIPAPARTIRDRLRDLLAGYADMSRRLWSEDFRRALVGLLAEEAFDVIQIEGIEMSPYLPEMQSAKPHLIYDAHNAEYALQEVIFRQDVRNPRRWHVALYSLIQTRRLKKVETVLCEAVDHIFACSETDAGLLRQIDRQTPLTVIPNAISTEDYTKEAGEPVTLPHPLLVFTGKMDYRPNVDAVLWFAGEILPLIRERLPDVHLAIVGKNPHARLAGLRERPEITLTGFVPDVLPYLRAAEVYIAPLRMGSGTRFKLLESMASGKAIVSTQIGAEGLGATDGDHLRLADTPEEFAQAVIELLQDESLRERLGENGRAFVRERYDWGAIIPQVEEVYNVI